MKPWRNQLLSLFRGRGPIRAPAALLALLGFLFTATTPGLALVTAAGPGIDVTGPLAVYVCHVAAGKDWAVPPGEESPYDDDDCCLLCQAAQLAHGAVPPQHFTLPTESAVPVRLAIVAQSLVAEGVFTPVQARGPPAV